MTFFLITHNVALRGNKNQYCGLTFVINVTSNQRNSLDLEDACWCEVSYVTTGAKRLDLAFVNKTIVSFFVVLNKQFTLLIR
uniref:Uncharacterized protein n=1 Tax=Anguilla anguilla TaxID=7936 RepID=A0A0E9TZL2_ANGAN